MVDQVIRAGFEGLFRNPVQRYVKLWWDCKFFAKKNAKKCDNKKNKGGRPPERDTAASARGEPPGLTITKSQSHTSLLAR